MHAGDQDEALPHGVVSMRRISECFSKASAWRDSRETDEANPEQRHALRKCRGVFWEVDRTAFPSAANPGSQTRAAKPVFAYARS
jgi:hypothetical protein